MPTIAESRRAVPGADAEPGADSSLAQVLRIGCDRASRSRSHDLVRLATVMLACEQIE
jgi:hypothetical protein